MHINYSFLLFQIITKSLYSGCGLPSCQNAQTILRKLIFESKTFIMHFVWWNGSGIWWLFSWLSSFSVAWLLTFEIIYSELMKIMGRWIFIYLKVKVKSTFFVPLSPGWTIRNVYNEEDKYRQTWLWTRQFLWTDRWKFI